MPVCPACEQKLEGDFINCPNCSHPINKRAFFIGHTVITLFIVLGFVLVVSLVYYFTSNQSRKVAMALYALRVMQHAEQQFKAEHGYFTRNVDDLEAIRPVKNFLPLFDQNRVEIDLKSSGFEIRGGVKGTSYRCWIGVSGEVSMKNCVQHDSS